jgi:phosphatidylglycerophosphate synthase
MLAAALRVYRETRKQHDQLFNTYVMRPVAAVVVAAIARTRVTPNQLTLLNLLVFLIAAAMLALFPSWRGGIAAVAVLETSYCLDCADGMLARYKKLASKVGHLFDFFTDETKATALVTALGIRAWRCGGFGFDGRLWAAQDARFLVAGIAGVFIVASALSLTNFVRRPEVSGRDTTVEAFYDAASRTDAGLGGTGVAALAIRAMRWLAHYPSHLWLWAVVGRMDLYLWLYIALHALYLVRGWVGIARRLGA